MILKDLILVPRNPDRISTNERRSWVSVILYRNNISPSLLIFIRTLVIKTKYYNIYMFFSIDFKKPSEFYLFGMLVFYIRLKFVFWHRKKKKKKPLFVISPERIKFSILTYDFFGYWSI